MDIKKKVLLPLTAGAAALASAVPVLASDSAMSGVETALTSSFTEVGTSMTGMIGKILPIALPIIGAVLVVGLGIKVFKKISNKAG